MLTKSTVIAPTIQDAPSIASTPKSLSARSLSDNNISPDGTYRSDSSCSEIDIAPSPTEKTKINLEKTNLSEKIDTEILKKDNENFVSEELGENLVNIDKENISFQQASKTIAVDIQMHGKFRFDWELPGSEKAKFIEMVNYLLAWDKYSEHASVEEVAQYKRDQKAVFNWLILKINTLASDELNPSIYASKFSYLLSNEYFNNLFLTQADQAAQQKVNRCIDRFKIIKLFDNFKNASLSKAAIKKEYFNDAISLLLNDVFLSATNKTQFILKNVPYDVLQDALSNLHEAELQKKLTDIFLIAINESKNFYTDSSDARSYTVKLHHLIIALNPNDLAAYAYANKLLDDTKYHEDVINSVEKYIDNFSAEDVVIKNLALQNLKILVDQLTSKQNFQSYENTHNGLEILRLICDFTLRNKNVLPKEKITLEDLFHRSRNYIEKSAKHLQKNAKTDDEREICFEALTLLSSIQDKRRAFFLNNDHKGFKLFSNDRCKANKAKSIAEKWYKESVKYQQMLFAPKNSIADVARVDNKEAVVISPRNGG